MCSYINIIIWYKINNSNTITLPSNLVELQCLKSLDTPTKKALKSIFDLYIFPLAARMDYESPKKKSLPFPSNALLSVSVMLTIHLVCIAEFQ